MDSLRQDIAYAVRRIFGEPGFAAVAVLTLALGIGANTAIFTIVNAVMIEPLPFRDPERLVVVWEETARRPGRPNVASPANFLRWRERASAFEGMAAMYDFRTNLSGRGDPEELIAQAVTPGFFRTLGISPNLGRAFLPGEGAERLSGRDRLTVLSYELWQRRFGGDQNIVGRAIQLGGSAVTVVGVMPPGVRLFLKAGSLTGKPPDLWLPSQFTDEQRKPQGRYMTAIARLKPGVSLGQAQAQMDTIASGLTSEWPDFDTGWTVRLVPLHAELAGELRPALLVLSGAVAFVLLIACANVANLLLARGAARGRELAIRNALGAGRFRIVRQLLTESVTLSLAGGVTGFLVAQWGLDFMRAVSPVDLTGLGHLGPSCPVLGFTAVISIATAAICGFLPALENSRTDLQERLKEGARQAGSTPRSRRLGQALVVAEIALALLLLVGAGLFIRSFASLRGVRPGFDPQDVLTARVALPPLKYDDDARCIRFFRDAVERVSRIPGVQAAGVVSFLPFTGLGAATTFIVEGQAAPAPGQSPVADVRVCDNGYFRAMGIPLVRGRLFSPREMQQRSDVVIVNDSLVRRSFPGEDPLGKRLLIDMTDPIVPTTIIGVVGDVRHVDLVTEPRPMTYWPHPQLTYSAMTLTVRTSGDPLAFSSQVQREIQVLDRDQPLSDVRSMDQWIGRSLARARFSWSLLAIFAAVALVLASIGIYGVMSYSVAQRTPEVAVRVALGATRGEVLRLMIGQGVALAALGVGLGIIGALIVTRFLSSLLFAVRPTDPVTFVLVALLLGGVGLLASYIPARRATRVDPIVALRYE